jgi:hypothetical protein
MSGGFGPCFEKSFIEYRRVKYLQDKLLDVVIHLEELEKRKKLINSEYLLHHNVFFLLHFLAK